MALTLAALSSELAAAATTTSFVGAGLPVTKKDGSVVVPITWIINKPAVSQIEYGPTASYGSLLTETTTHQQFHSIVLPGAAAPLDPVAVYHYRIRTTDASGNLAVSGDQTFKTFKCGDGICSRENGESEILCPGDCRRTSCENVVTAYQIGQSSLTARLAAQLGAQVSLAYTYPMKATPSQTSLYGLSSFANIESFVYKANSHNPIDASDTAITVYSNTAGAASDQKPFTKPPIPLPAEFSIEWEEVLCTGFDAAASAYTGCRRGYNDTFAVAHPSYTAILDDAGLNQYMISLGTSLPAGYYALDDQPGYYYASPNNPVSSNYIPLLQKLYLTVKNYDRQHPVLASINTQVPGWPSLSPGMFDLGNIYVYPNREGVQDPPTYLARAISLSTGNVQRALGYLPPFVGIYQAFYGGLVRPYLYPSLALMKSQIDAYADAGASLVGYYTTDISDPAWKDYSLWKTPFTDATLRSSVYQANQHAVKKYCPAFSFAPPAILSPPSGSVQPSRFNVAFKPSGSFGSYVCEAAVTDHGLFDSTVSTYSSIRVLASTAVYNAANNAVASAAIDIPPASTDANVADYVVAVRCRNGSVQNFSTVTIHIGMTIPVIISTPSVTGTMGRALSYQITATNSPTSFSAAGLPAGLSVSTGGLVSGTPTAIGTSSVAISASNSSGTGSITLTLNVYSACDLNRDWTANVMDVQWQVNAALGAAVCTSDLNGDGACNVIDVQRNVNAGLGGSCLLGP